jgi:hypothetical protein
MCYRNGFGTASDPQLAKVWLDKAAETQEGQELIAKIPQNPARVNSSIVVPSVLLAIVGALILGADDGDDIYDESHKHCEFTTNYLKNAQQHAAGCKEEWEVIR